MPHPLLLCAQARVHAVPPQRHQLLVVQLRPLLMVLRLQVVLARFVLGALGGGTLLLDLRDHGARREGARGGDHLLKRIEELRLCAQHLGGDDREAREHVGGEGTRRRHVILPEVEVREGRMQGHHSSLHLPCPLVHQPLHLLPPKRLQVELGLDGLDGWRLRHPGRRPGRRRIFHHWGVPPPRGRPRGFHAGMFPPILPLGGFPPLPSPP
mmetsp:Transcript_68642/g.217104  ORF Transcript_68642/g.217104 Transcript_68642/m.217104 type:complete len:211 (+) Transcript_68642:519-1151(+)